MGRYLAILLIGLLLPRTGVPFSYGSLTRIIREHKVRSIDELIPLLPEYYRKNYTFVYRSRGLQASLASPEWPRTILYGEDAKLILAFHKNPATPPVSSADDLLEIIEFNDAKAAFQFRVLHFVPGKDPLAKEPEINPAVCKNCHGQDPRPNWDSYNLWPGAYGSVSRSDCDTMQEGTRELRNYVAFLAGNRKQDRYRHLPPETPRLNKCPQPPHRDHTFRNAVNTNPNAKLTDRLYDLNARRLKRLIIQSPSFPAFKYLWAALAKDCLTDVEKFFPPNYAVLNKLPDFETTKRELKAFAAREFAERLKAFYQNNQGSEYDPYRVPVNFLNDGSEGQYTQLDATARFKIVADRSRVSTARWETGFSDGTWLFTTPAKGISEIFRNWSVPGVGYQSCDELAAKSVEALGNPQLTTSFSPTTILTSY